MSDVDPLQPTTKVQIIETELRSIWETSGRLEPTEVVTLAADPEHPLHPMFEWDDTEAARRYRLGQARAMIRSVRINVVTADNGNVDDFKIRAWVSARAAGTGQSGYLPEDEVRMRPEQRDRVLRQMVRELNAYRRRYQHMSEFWAGIGLLPDEQQEAG